MKISLKKYTFRDGEVVSLGAFYSDDPSLNPANLNIMFHLFNIFKSEWWLLAKKLLKPLWKISSPAF